MVVCAGIDTTFLDVELSPSVNVASQNSTVVSGGSTSSGISGGQGGVVFESLYSDRLDCYLAGSLVLTLARGTRSPINGRGRVIDYRHFVEELKRKPQAFKGLVFRDALFPRDAYRRTWEQLELRHAVAFFARLAAITAPRAATSSRPRLRSCAPAATPGATAAFAVATCVRCGSPASPRHAACEASATACSSVACRAPACC
jgi:hypothetical protein